MKSRAALQTTLEDEAYQHEILQQVSRTFALTIPQLPAPLYLVVANAYLLCRIADTIEDDKAMAAAVKRDYAERFIKVVNGTEQAQDFSISLFALLSDTATAAEHDLIANTATVIQITHRFNQRQRAALERCVAIMAQGMAQYQDSETLDGLQDTDDLGQYCYYVAGVVGEMLTELFCDYCAEIDAHRATLMPLAVSFGQGLQMTNILKDIWEDHARGVCWLPQRLFKQHGICLRQKSPDQPHPDFDQALLELLGLAHAHIANALRYTLLLPAKEPGLRRFCLWALGMAVLTLDKIRQTPGFNNGQQVKISRRAVKVTIFLTSLFARHDRALQCLLWFAGRRLPMADIRDKIKPPGK